MDREELKAIVAQMLRELAPAQTPPSPPPVKGAETAPEAPPDDGVLPDLTTVDLRAQYLVPNAAHGAEFRALKAKTPARLGLGRCGARYPTASMLRFRADHAAAQDSVFSLVPERFWEENHYPFVQTMCKSKDEYLTRPDLGRRFDEKNQAVLRDLLAGQRVVLAVGDGLSSAAVQANAPDCCAAIRQGLQAQGIELGPVPFIQFCRVGAGDHIGDLTDCEVICLLVGERPGLVTNESMSAYLTYRPHTGIAESCRTVVSNIHRQGVSAVEAGAHIASLIGRILAIGVPSMIMVAIGSVMYYGMNLVLMRFEHVRVGLGEVGTAVFGAYYKLQSFIFMPVFGINNAALAIAAYNYGARKPKRILGVLKCGILSATALMVIGVAAFQLIPQVLLGLFNANADMLAVGDPALRTMSLAFVFAGACIIVGGVFQALGNSVYSMIVSIARQLVVLLPVAYLLSLSGNIDAVWFAFPIAEVASLTMTVILFLRLYRKKIRPLSRMPAAE